MKFTFSLLAVLAISSAFALAKEKQDPAEGFKKLDTNSDNKVSLEEFLLGKKNPEKAKESFKSKDKDGDGSLTLEEFSAHGEKKAK